MATVNICCPVNFGKNESSLYIRSLLLQVVYHTSQLCQSGQSCFQPLLLSSSQLLNGRNDTLNVQHALADVVVELLLHLAIHILQCHAQSTVWQEALMTLQIVPASAPILWDADTLV